MPREVQWTISFAIGGLILWAGWKLPILLLAFHVIVCFVLAIVVLLQSGSAADLAGAFGGAGSQTAFGPRGAATVLSKATTWCAVMFMMTSMLLFARQDLSLGGGAKSIMEKYSKPASSAPAPAKPAPIAPPVTPPPGTPPPGR